MCILNKNGCGGFCRPGYEFHEDISQILAGVPWSEINELSFFDQLEESELEEFELEESELEESELEESEVELNDDDSNPPDTLENSELDLIPDFIQGENFVFIRNEGNANLEQSSRNHTTVKLLEREVADKDGEFCHSSSFLFGMRILCLL
jgi:hypothetical protein